MSTHSKCGREIPGGTSGGHCAKCCRSFRGTAAFDNHLRRREDGHSDCLDPATATKPKTGELHPYWEDDKGIWHYGARGYWDDKEQGQ